MVPANRRQHRSKDQNIEQLGNGRKISPPVLSLNKRRRPGVRKCYCVKLTSFEWRSQSRRAEAGLAARVTSITAWRGARHGLRLRTAQTRTFRLSTARNCQHRDGPEASAAHSHNSKRSTQHWLAPESQLSLSHPASNAGLHRHTKNKNAPSGSSTRLTSKNRHRDPRTYARRALR